MAKKGTLKHNTHRRKSQCCLAIPIPPPIDAESNGSDANQTPRISTANTPTAKSRTVAVRLISMAMTGYYRTLIRPRVHRPLSMMKYDPVVKKQVLFLEATKGGKNK
ncbi:Ribosomal protein L33 [Penicillium brevicompactum]